MFLSLPGLAYDVSWHEGEISRLLSANAPLDENTQLACEHFGRISTSVFTSLQRPHAWRSWCVDDFLCESLQYSAAVASLSGAVYWLSGGARCERFRIDVALDLRPLLYSYKFTCDATERQTLYIAKKPTTWEFST